MQQSSKKQLYSLFIGQLVLAIMAVLLCAFWGVAEALAAGFGALILLFANLVFAIRFFASSDYAPGHVILRFYTGALFKWVVLLVGMAVTLFLHLSFWAFIVGFISTQIGFYLAPLVFVPNTEGVKA